MLWDIPILNDYSSFIRNSNLPVPAVLRLAARPQGHCGLGRHTAKADFRSQKRYDSSEKKGWGSAVLGATMRFREMYVFVGTIGAFAVVMKPLPGQRAGETRAPRGTRAPRAHAGTPEHM